MRGKDGTISAPTSLQLSSGSKSAELCLFSSVSFGPLPGLGVPPSFSALSHSEAVTVSPAFYHSILLSLLASDSAKRLALSLLPRIAVVGRGVGDTPKGRRIIRGAVSKGYGERGGS